MARGNFSQSRKWNQKSKRSQPRNSRSGARGNSRSSRSQGESSKVPIGRWLILILLVWGGYQIFKPNSLSSIPAENEKLTKGQAQQAQLASASLASKNPSGSKAPHEAAQATKTPSGKAAQSNTKDFKEYWVESRKHLGQGFVLEEMVFPNEESVWVQLFFHGDTGAYYQDTLLTFVSEAWNEVVRKNTQKVTLKILKNGKGSIRYWSWKSGSWKGEYYKRDSSWVKEDGCPIDKLCRQPILKHAQNSNAKKHFKSEYWKSDSSLAVYAPFDGNIVEHGGSPKSGRQLILSSYHGEKLLMKGLGNVTPGLKVGSKIHAGMKLGTLLHQKKSLYTEYTRQGRRSWLKPLVEFKVDSVFQNRVSQIRKVLKRS